MLSTTALENMFNLKSFKIGWFSASPVSTSTARTFLLLKSVLRRTGFKKELEERLKKRIAEVRVSNSFKVFSLKFGLNICESSATLLKIARQLKSNFHHFSSSFVASKQNCFGKVLIQMLAQNLNIGSSNVGSDVDSNVESNGFQCVDFKPTQKFKILTQNESKGRLKSQALERQFYIKKFGWFDIFKLIIAASPEKWYWKMELVAQKCLKILER